MVCMSIISGQQVNSDRESLYTLEMCFILLETKPKGGAQGDKGKKPVNFPMS